MSILLEHPVARRIELPGAPEEAAARRQLRAQVARLEAALAAAVADSFPGDPVVRTGPDRDGPRLLSLGELERVRDDLHARVGDARGALAERAEREAAARRLRDRMLADPAGHRFVRVSARECGEAGCGVYSVRPRLGLLGMLAGWWEVKLSSGCP